MFALFLKLYVSMFTGEWVGNTSNNMLQSTFTPILKELGTFITSIFGDNQMTNFGETLSSYTSFGSNAVGVPNYLLLISLVLALITSIGIVVMAVKGVKKAFGIFFMGIR